MSRPTDWSVVGWDHDPTPGDPVVIRAGGEHYLQVAETIDRAARTLRALNAGGSSGAESVTALLENSEQLAGQLETAAVRHRVTGNAVVGYAVKLDRIQASTAQALVIAKAARAEADECRRLAKLYRRYANEATDPEEKARYVRLETRKLGEERDAEARVSAQETVMSQGATDQLVAGDEAAAQIEHVTSTDGLNDSWWDDWGSKILNIIASLAELISTIAGILALLVCWIPVIGQALAGVLLAVAAIAAIVAALANIVLAATGEKSWGEAVLSIVGAVLACVGLKGAFLAGKAAFAVIMKSGSKLAAGQSAGRLGTFLMRGLMRPGALARITAGKTLSNIRGRIGEEIVNIVSNTGKQGFKLLTGRIGKPDGALRFLGRFFFGECKNLGWNTLKPGVLTATAQMRGYVDLAVREGGGVLRVFVNDMTEFQPLLNAVGTKAIPDGKVVVTTFEQVLGTKLDAWVQATVGSGVQVSSLVGGN